MNRYKDLKFWQLSREFCSLIYKITANYPKEEQFGLISQLRRAAVSIPSNIAEGCSRKSDKDFSRFLIIALGSCYELDTQLLISNDLCFISTEELKDTQDKLQRIIKMMSKFNSTLKIQ